MKSMAMTMIQLGPEAHDIIWQDAPPGMEIMA